MKILVTGFEPFGGAVINPAYEAVKLLPDVIAGAEVIKIEIPTVFGKDEEVVRAAVEKHHPDWCIERLLSLIVRDTRFHQIDCDFFHCDPGSSTSLSDT